MFYKNIIKILIKKKSTKGKDKLPLTGETKENNNILLSIITAIFGSSLLLLRRKNMKNK